MLHAIIFFTHTDILPDSCNSILVSGKIKAKDLLNDGVSGCKLLDRAQICECVCVCIIFPGPLYKSEATQLLEA